MEKLKAIEELTKYGYERIIREAQSYYNEITPKKIAIYNYYKAQTNTAMSYGTFVTSGNLIDEMTDDGLEENEIIP